MNPVHMNRKKIDLRVGSNLTDEIYKLDERKLY